MQRHHSCLGYRVSNRLAPLADARSEAEAEAVRDLLLIRWVEATAGHIVGDQQLCRFLRCVASETAWSVDMAEAPD